MQIGVFNFSDMARKNHESDSHGMVILVHIWGQFSMAYFQVFITIAVNSFIQQHKKIRIDLHVCTPVRFPIARVITDMVDLLVV